MRDLLFTAALLATFFFVILTSCVNPSLPTAVHALDHAASVTRAALVVEDARREAIAVACEYETACLSAAGLTPETERAFSDAVQLASEAYDAAVAARDALREVSP